jgi:transcriptional regulator with XRE-family HTH domain
MRYEELRRLLGQRVQMLRERREWNQRQMQAKSGVAHKSISNLESTESGVQLDTLHNVAEAFGMEVWELLRPWPHDTLREDGADYGADPLPAIQKEGPPGLRMLAADAAAHAALGITPAEWRLLAAVGNVLPPPVDKAGFVQLLFTLRAICR